MPNSILTCGGLAPTRDGTVEKADDRSTSSLKVLRVSAATTGMLSLSSNTSASHNKDRLSRRTGPPVNRYNSSLITGPMFNPENASKGIGQYTSIMFSISIGSNDV